jgi:DNA polymerase (family 10)
MAPREPREPVQDASPRLVASNARIAAVLAEIADLLEIDGASSFKVGAYRRAADSVARAPEDVAAAIRSGRQPALRGVGSTISERIAELADSGRLGYHDELRARVPPTLLELLSVPGVGPRTAGEAWRQLGVATLDDLEVAARAGRLRRLRGVSATSEARILAAIADVRQRPPRRMRMDEAHDLATRVTELLETLPDVDNVLVAGSVRRGRESVGDLDLLVTSRRPRSALAAITGLAVVEPAGEPDDRGRADVDGPGDVATSARVRAAGVGAEAAETGAEHAGPDVARRASLRIVDGPSMDVMVIPPGAAGSYEVHLTGSAAHNTALRHRAREADWSLSEHGLVPLGDPGAAPRTFATEAELYRFLGLDFVPAELREGHGELEAAAAGTLPQLIERPQLRGDCHSHTDWSDGREPLAVMMASARAEGREYQVITDHSQGLAVANGLDPARVRAQARVIADLNERFAREAQDGLAPPSADPGFRVLHGTELEITTDGRLDYEDDLLATFDVVVASLHVGRQQPRARLMARYAVAMRNPRVHIISHPSGRKIGRREPLDLDWEAFYRLAAETGTMLEINGSPARLDLGEDHVRAAAEAGCLFTIDSDAHARSEWRHLDWGTIVARRGWLEPARVANTRPLGAFLELVRDKGHAA